GFVTDTVLKSGTNQWHGSLFEYNRIQALAANSFFSNRSGTKDALVRNQFGGSVGGPIVKDKTFFYFTTEIHRRRQGTPLTADTVTPDFLNFVNTGEFENFVENDPGGICNNPALYDAHFGAGAGVVAAPCPGAFAQSATLGPIFQNLLSSQASRFPLCVPGSASCPSSGLVFNGFGPWDGPNANDSTVPFAGVTYPVPVMGLQTIAQPDKLDQTRYSVKFDHKLGNNDQINVAYLYDNADETTAFGGGQSFIGPDISVHGRAQNAGVTWSHTFSPTVLNQARMSYVRHTALFPADPSAFAGGIPALFTAFDPLGEGFGNASNLPQFFIENEFVYKDDLSVTKGKHNFKSGAEYRRTRNGSDFEADHFGNFAAYTVQDLVTDMRFNDNADAAVFTNLVGEPYAYYGSWFYAEAAIDPTKHPATRPNSVRGFRANEVAAYFQDDWRILPRLTLNLGVRWEYFGPPHNFQPNIDSNFYTGAPLTPILCGTPPAPCTNPFLPVGNPALASFATGTLQVKNSDIWHKDTNNWGPRFGFAYDTFGNQKLVIRGGAGVAYDRMYNNIFENIRFNPPFFCFCNFGAFINGVPGGGIETPGVYAVPFNNQAAFNDPTILPVLPKTSPRAIDQNLVTAYYEQANFGFQYEFMKDFVLETNYVGTWGRKLLGIINLNTFPGRSGAGFSSARPNPLVNNINLRTNGFASNYNALQVTLRKNYSHGLQLDANYTYAKALDQISDAFTPRGVAANLNPSDSLNTHLDYGPADFNVKHRFVFSFNYDLPLFKGNRWLGGWSTSGIATLQGGVPFSLTDSSTSYDLNRNGTFNDRISYIGTGSITHALTGGSAANGFFDTTLFAPTVCPASVNDGRWCEGQAVGQSNRNPLIGPSFQNVDFGVAKKFKITESAAIQFQANFFNLFNRTNFNLPNGDINNSNFGLSTSTLAPGAGGARVTQLALRFDF
ncbi:MAG: TonB-dependent receptor, partial [Acidobacteriia bacterium]|nr:TonB-dependent receptor [Terriglobia bacterium]